MADPITLLAFKLLLAYATSPEANAPLPYQPEGPTLPEVAEAALHCYHPSGRLADAAITEAPWSGAAAWQAERSSVLRIDWSGGLTGQPYVLVVALIERGGAVRGVLLGDSAIVPPSPRCSLDHWQPAQ